MSIVYKYMIFYKDQQEHVVIYSNNE
jgi:hypothetical protein